MHINIKNTLKNNATTLSNKLVEKESMRLCFVYLHSRILREKNDEFFL
jgi:hypothetical protein